MIARYLPFFLLLLLLPDRYLYLTRVKGKSDNRWKRRLFLFVPTIGMLIYTGILYFQPDFQPANPVALEVYLWLLGIVVVPKAIFALCSWLGRVVRRIFCMRRNYGNLLGIILALLCMYITAYGFTKGIRKLEVKHVDLYFSDLPKAFEGYRIALFSDLHIGSFANGREQILHNVLDSIQAQRADLIVFAGDLQNQRPTEIYPYRQRLAALRAKDGVVSVLGNHDYALYIKADTLIAHANEQETQRLQRQMGWKLLKNEHFVLHRGESDSIVVVGLDDEGEKPQHKRADIDKAMQGILGKPFTIVVEHEPPYWRDKIMPDTDAQLTLSGHTHGGQVTVFGFTPIKWKTKYVAGHYEEEGQQLYITSGIGGLIPFRYEVTPEIVVITLHRKR